MPLVSTRGSEEEALGERVTKTIRRPDDKPITFRGNVYVAALGVWAVIGLVCWLVMLVK
jgi:hypothetical protein